MIRLYVLGEGLTEEAVVKRMLASHLAERDVFATAMSLGGGSRWGAWRHFLHKLVKQERGADVRFTTMLDLYGLPKDFPGNREARAIADTRRRVQVLEDALRDDLGDARVVPYIQRHEVEALVLAALDELAMRLPEEREGVGRLRRELGGQPPEDVNDGVETHPSKRLARHVPGYGKVADGVAVIERAGLGKIRAACPRFDAWIATLEALAT